MKPEQLIRILGCVNGELDDRHTASRLELTVTNDCQDFDEHR